MSERERAEQLFSYIHYHSGEKGIDAILAFAREERARTWEEAAERVGKHDDLYLEWTIKARALREEGGHDQ